ncbi:xanthine dehydrogenase family protein molybdopterin-binding subunit [Alteribacillus sp. YIM 98480]|uniref:xanthine dehydrogenase family protein molybdopterin-binding subunit n=1 Tax=Alteribacillus sp. YIM 98480 TaxID=2606599 RepID=UPI00131EC32B|nr:xanthine dehydrogenase family protein molybdopterin-binding subunit [Alteribacillus sp. YIM 98480]
MSIDIQSKPTETPSKDKKWVGSKLNRLEDKRLIRGKGNYMEDLKPLPNIHHAAILRSPHGHARIKKIDYTKAIDIPGVRSVLVGDDIRDWVKPFPVVADNPGKYFPMAIDKVRYVGEPVAVVIAENQYVAEDALDLINVEYEALSATVNIEEAISEEAPLLHEEEGTNVAIQRNTKFGNVDEAFEEADTVVKERVVFNRFTCMPLETYGVIGHWDSSNHAANIWCNFQGPFSMHAVMAKALGVVPNKLRIMVPSDVGGGFGIKITIYPYSCLITLASRKAGVPVKWIEDRRENLIGSSSGTDRVTYMEMAAKKDGTITGVRYKIMDSVGAYIRPPEPGTIFRPYGNYSGPYKFRNVELDLTAVMTNKVPTGPNRGYSCGQLYHALERTVDKLAHTLNIDPVDLRRKNILEPSQFPYTTPTGGYYDVGDYPAVLNKLLKSADYKQLLKKQEEMRKQGRHVGIGISLAVDPAASNMGYMDVGTPKDHSNKERPKSGSSEAATITIDYGGGITVTLNTAPQGQGHETVAAQIVADQFGCSPYDILVTTGSDTGTRAWTIASGAYSSRFSGTAANAILMACEGLIVKMKKVASHLMECSTENLDVIDGKVVHKEDAQLSMSLKKLAGIIHWNPTILPDEISNGLTHTSYFSLDSVKPVDENGRVNSSGLYSFAVDLALVEIDKKTFELNILKYYMAHDIGKSLNPQIVEGQLYGGMLHGLANTLYEEMVYDKNGQILTGTLMDYTCPTSAESIDLEIDHLETPSTLTPLGARGTGEVATMTVPAALTNAVNDALKPYNVVINDLPITPSKLFSILKEAEK